MRFSIYEKTGFGFLAAAGLVWGADFTGNILVQAEPLKKAVFMAAKAPAAEKAAPAAKAEGSVMAMLADADTGAGQKAFKKCKACHSTDKGGKNKVGPNLFGIIGGARAKAAGFKYSNAITKMGGNWSYEDMNKFLTKPKSFLPGTKMAFNGLKSAGDRAAVILFLRSFADTPAALPK